MLHGQLWLIHFSTGGRPLVLSYQWIVCIHNSEYILMQVTYCHKFNLVLLSAAPSVGLWNYVCFPPIPHMLYMDIVTPLFVKVLTSPRLSLVADISPIQLML